MNGTAVFDAEESVIDRRPIITCAGELEVFSPIEDNLSQALPQDSCEWKRAMGRPVRPVHIGANFAPFSSAALPKSNQWDLIRQPLFHIYWTECTDVDTYKNTVRDDIEAWLKELAAKDTQDWLIVVVENYDGKRANKLLPRTTVLDKIRADFAPKQGDRCISVINPGKVESRSADSWRGLVGRLRHLLLVAYAKAVSRLEDYVRHQRERRNGPGWQFMKYFQLQEELAQILEMLGLYDEALVQYDELDALFSQFIVNGVVGDSVSWLIEFQKPLERWHALKLGPSTLPKNPSLLELRAYLFGKQAHMLLLTNKVWEMASRCVPFLHTCTRELTILEIQSPAGTVACWLFLASMEVLQTCDKFNDADAVEDYSLHTACLWEYASQKLRELGELCGLMPGGTPTSAQLHIVVGLSAGMGDNPGTPTSPSPTDKLKEALCSQDAFNKMYLELAELAMGTYKHIGRLRSARLVGIQLASFYMLLGEIQKSAAFLTDAVRTFQQDGWNELAALTQVDLAACHKKSKDIKKYIQTCASISSVQEIDTLIRWTYFDEMRSSLETLDEQLIVPFDDIIKIVSVNVKSDPVIMQDSSINVEIVIDSNFPREVVCTDVRVSLEEESKDKKGVEKYCSGRVLTTQDLKPQDPLLQRLKIYRHVDYKQDKQLESASVVCPHTSDNKRKESSMATPPSSFTSYLQSSTSPLVITPGINVLRLNKKTTSIGKYYLGQVAVHIGKLQLLSPHLTPRLSIEVKEEGPSVKLYKGAAPLFSGIEQIMNLILTMGSYTVDPKSKIKLTSSMGLTFQVEPDQPLTNMLEFEVGDREPFSSKRTKLRVFADMLSKSHQVSITCQWSPKPILVNLSFTPPLNTTWRLSTSHHRKFVQVTVTGQCDLSLNIEQPKLSIGEACKVVDYNCDSSQIITQGLSCSFLWELQVTPSMEVPPIKTEFSLVYRLADNTQDDKIYQYFFDITDYQTLYVLEADVEPTKGSEFCRAGALCHLHLTIKSVGQYSKNAQTRSVMYEVLAEQSMWAVCGRSAGVVSFDADIDKQSVVLDVMPISSGHLPLPLIRLSKYITGETDKSGRPESQSRLEPFSVGQVYNSSKGKQVHVITGINDSHAT